MAEYGSKKTPVLWANVWGGTATYRSEPDSAKIVFLRGEDDLKLRWVEALHAHDIRQYSMADTQNTKELSNWSLTDTTCGRGHKSSTSICTNSIRTRQVGTSRPCLVLRCLSLTLSNVVRRNLPPVRTVSGCFNASLFVIRLSEYVFRLH